MTTAADIKAQTKRQAPAAGDELTDEAILSIWRKHYPMSVPGQLTLMAARDLIAADRAARSQSPTCQTFGAGVSVPCSECNVMLVDAQEWAARSQSLERKPLTDAQRTHIRATALTIDEALDMAEAALGLTAPSEKTSK